MKNESKFITASEIKNHVISAALASSVLFGYGYHPTVNALIVTAVWIFLAFAGAGVIVLTFVTVAIRKNNRNDKELGIFYKALSALHGHPIKRLLDLSLVGYWLYALTIQEWTVTAVIYLIIVVCMQLFIFLTKDIAKNFFVGQLKGKGINEDA